MPILIIQTHKNKIFILHRLMMMELTEKVLHKKTSLKLLKQIRIPKIKVNINKHFNSLTVDFENNVQSDIKQLYTDEEIENFRCIFLMFDKEKNGYIEVTDL